MEFAFERWILKRPLRMSFFVVRILERYSIGTTGCALIYLGGTILPVERACTLDE
jgi:hypothetical protein